MQYVNALGSQALSALLHPPVVGPLSPSGQAALVPSCWHCVLCCRRYARQYVFVAATLPAESKMSVGAQLQRRFPGLRWLHSERLHQGQRSLRHTWLEVDEQGWQTALQARPHTIS